MYQDLMIKINQDKIYHNYHQKMNIKDYLMMKFVNIND